MDTFKTPNSDESLASYVSRVRKKLNLTQSELADAAGIHGRSVGKIERGLTVKINRRTLQGLAISYAGRLRHRAWCTPRIFGCCNQG